ncbi:hypothetical protein PG994_006468 [Apiospora phragmitis]|uniref:Uncharacterized protein n=1 Tax=Apiospora phragmitis TaxID=2905665 RepID=A0ABR1VFA2_9PEZI
MPTYGIQLLDVLPHAGFVISNRKPFTKRPQRDKLVKTQFRHANVIGGAYNKRNESRRALDVALEAVFVTAAKEDVRAALNEDGYLDFVNEVKKHVEWAQQLSSSVFLDFFTALLRARVGWNVAPREPRDPDKQSATAKAAQALLDLEPGL